MSTNKALFNKEKMIFYTANAFIQDLIHDMLKLTDRPKGAFNASARVVQNWLSTKIVAVGAKSPTSVQKGNFFSGGKPKIGMSGGGPELLKEAAEAYEDGTLKKFLGNLEGVYSSDELFFELMETLITYNLLIQLNGQVTVKENPVFFTTTATLTAAENKCYSFETLIIDFEKVRELSTPHLMDDDEEMGGVVKEEDDDEEDDDEMCNVQEDGQAEEWPIVQYEGGIFFHGKIYENVQVQYFNKNKLFYEEYDTMLDSRIQSCWPPIKIEGLKRLSKSNKLERWEAVNTNIRLFIQLDELGVIIIYPYKAMASKAPNLPDIQLVWYGTDGEEISTHFYNANSANYLFQFSPTGHQYATTMMSCNAQQQLSDWLIFNYAPENIRKQLFGYNFYVNDQGKKLKVIDITEGPAGNVLSIEAMEIDDGEDDDMDMDDDDDDDDDDAKKIETFLIGKFEEGKISLTNSLGEKISRTRKEEEEKKKEEDIEKIVNECKQNAEDEEVVTNSGEQGGGGGGEKIPQLASVSITWMVLIGVQVFNTPLSQYIRNFKESVINDTTSSLKWENTLAKLQYEHLWPYMSIRELTTGAEAQSFGWQKRIKPTGPINLKAANNSAFDSDFMKAFKKFMRDPARRNEGLKGIFGSCDDAKNKPVCTYIADINKRRMGITESKSGGIETTKDTIWEVMKRNNDCFPSEDYQDTKQKWVDRGNYFTSGERKTDKYLINNAIGISSRGRSLPYLDNMDNNWFCPITSSIDPQATCKMTDNKPLEWNSYKSAMEWGKMDVTVGISGESPDLERIGCSLKYRIKLEPNFTRIDSSTGVVYNRNQTVSEPQVSHKKELKIGQEILLGEVGGIDNSEFTIKLGDDVSKETDAKNSLLKLISTTTLLLDKDIKGYMGLMKKIKIPLIKPKYYYVAANPQQANSVGAEEVTLSQAYTSPFGGIHAMRRDFPLLKGGEVKKITKSASKGINPSLFFIDNHLQKNDRVIKIEINDIPVDREKLYGMRAALQDQVTKARSINFGSKCKKKYLIFVCVFNIENGKIGLVPHDSISNSLQKFPENDIWTLEKGEEAYRIRREIAAAASTKLTGDQIQEFGGVMSNGGYVGDIYKAGQNLPIYMKNMRRTPANIVGTTPSILPPDQGRVMLGNDQPSSIRAMVMALYAKGDINKKSIVGYMPVDGYFVVASPNGGDWTSAEGGAKRKKRKKKKTKKRKTKKRKRKKIKTRRRNKKRGTKKNNKKRRVTRHKK